MTVPELELICCPGATIFDRVMVAAATFEPVIVAEPIIEPVMPADTAAKADMLPDVSIAIKLCAAGIVGSVRLKLAAIELGGERVKNLLAATLLPSKIDPACMLAGVFDAELTIRTPVENDAVADPLAIPELVAFTVPPEVICTG